MAEIAHAQLEHTVLTQLAHNLKCTLVVAQIFAVRGILPLHCWAITESCVHPQHSFGATNAE
jgi:hypothetical protein